MTATGFAREARADAALTAGVLAVAGVPAAPRTTPSLAVAPLLVPAGFAGLNPAGFGAIALAVVAFWPRALTPGALATKALATGVLTLVVPSLAVLPATLAALALGLAPTPAPRAVARAALTVVTLDRLAGVSADRDAAAVAVVLATSRGAALRIATLAVGAFADLTCVLAPLTPLALAA